MSIKIRRYEERDLKDIQRILSRLPSPTGKCYDAREMIRDAVKEQPDGIFVIEVDHEVQGVAIVLFKDWFQIAYLDFIGVDQSHARKGLGSALMRKCIEWSISKGARILYTETGSNNRVGIAFYKKWGFVQTGYIPCYYTLDCDAIILVRPLNKQ